MSNPTPDMKLIKTCSRMISDTKRVEDHFRSKPFRNYISK